MHQLFTCSDMLIFTLTPLIPIILLPAGWCSTSCLCSGFRARLEWLSRYSATRRPPPLPPRHRQRAIRRPLSNEATSRQPRRRRQRRPACFRRERRVRISRSTAAAATLLPLLLLQLLRSTRHCTRAINTGARCTCTRRSRRY